MTVLVPNRGASLALVAGALVGVGLAVAAAPFIGVLVVVVIGVILLALKQRLLWAGMLVLFAAVPLAYLPVPNFLLTVSPPALIALVLLVRSMMYRSSPPFALAHPVALLLGALGGWLTLSVAASAYRAVAVGWLLSYGLLVLLPALLSLSDEHVRLILTRTWVALGAALGAYALLETFVLHANPLLDPIYTASARGALTQEWSVYRATTTLGHPVGNGSFFAIAVPLALGGALYRRSVGAAVAAALAAGGVVASGSRSAFAAMLLGAAVVLFLPARTQSSSGLNCGASTGVSIRVKSLGATVLLATLVLGSAYLAVRDSSGEGQASAAFRATQVPIAAHSVTAAPLLGTGPGAASLSQESLLARIGGAGAFESYWLELVVGAGIPGLVLGAAVIVTAFGMALRSGAPDVAAAVLVWATTATFFNALEGGRPGLLVLGLVLSMAFSGSACGSGAPG